MSTVYAVVGWKTLWTKDKLDHLKDPIRDEDSFDSLEKLVSVLPAEDGFRVYSLKHFEELVELGRLSVAHSVKFVKVKD